MLLGIKKKRTWVFVLLVFQEKKREHSRLGWHRPAQSSKCQHLLKTSVAESSSNLRVFSYYKAELCGEPFLQWWSACWFLVGSDTPWEQVAGLCGSVSAPWLFGNWRLAPQGLQSFSLHSEHLIKRKVNTVLMQSYD